MGASGVGAVAGAEEREGGAAGDLVGGLVDGGGEVAATRLGELLPEVLLEGEELVRLEPAVARVAEEGDEDEAVAVAPANLPVAGEGDAVDVAGPPWVGLDLALDHVAEPDVACTMGRGGGEEAWKQKGAASIKICPVVVEESLLTISCMHG